MAVLQIMCNLCTPSTDISVDTSTVNREDPGTVKVELFWWGVQNGRTFHLFSFLFEIGQLLAKKHSKYQAQI